MLKNLSPPNAITLSQSNRLKSKILKKIAQTGPLTFAHYMHLALYESNFGYYSTDVPKFGEAGDFITAPEISPIFSRCIARQCYQILNDLNGGDILELGAGTGIMAVDILKELQHNQFLPNHYFILEVSKSLRLHQTKLLQKEVPELFHHVVWLDQLPTHFTGVIIGNEIIDAIPAHKFRIENNTIKEIYVDGNKGALLWKIDNPSSSDLVQQVKSLGINFPNDYESEINLLLKSWITSLANTLKKGLILLIDYGFPQHEYYHQDRNRGTITCYYRHHSHFNPLIFPGIQDITIHVNFTAIAKIAAQNHLTVAGFVHQANFLLNCGIISFASSLKNTIEHFQITQQIKKLIFPSEMGELFKVIALTRNYDAILLGFKTGNQIARLAL
ncbi:class I SAM-dependent methyltransferase [Coxiella endosymbiont of Amblyomma americanum]|uniref:class I SAM-dependent methyltransferase n=1 Tax=Coxiella endosymbiont of Amblyomma americanum TaxID=325775 RepID=UPI00057F1138|nr:SAM-dependent methyltransferase [Coxiella endosymbiont of Amblyomma americanum]AJC50196.1 hypothetical protein Z664_00275 [Coxiella endosymbiont of Amblyomma americanum]AUJ58557.1 SAM-dependent methyltransferase [Coxiella-like endosymbiont of Amblyomma americanum]